MKSKLILSLFFNGLLFSSCTYPKENILITSNNVSRCYFESEVVDFCSKDKIEIYNQHIKDLPNFSNDKILLILNHNRNTGKGESRVVKLIVILDPLEKKVIPVPQMVGNFVDDNLREISDDPAIIKYNKKDNKVCLSGTTYFLKNNNINIENECYKFEKGRVNKIEDLRLNGIEEFSKVPYSSDIHFKCINNIKLNQCNKLRLISSQKILNKYNFINPQDGMSVFLKGEKDFFLIVSPFFDEEGANLRIMKVKDFSLISERYIYAGKNVEIDDNLNIKYFEGNNKKEFSF
ncbi:hypothetical protein [Acinetobacter schindleri]|uniref:Lipoprotein n=1 Tax=Acinetobacter schindleri TaxID=108981 RepID=A0AAE6WTE4_9GAMM|nr:hypothetical protein [Acinetobacter schindleri]QIC66031.1 hypothetical protein FSC10_00970 [Acinetobacter schindleri]